MEAAIHHELLRGVFHGTIRGLGQVSRTFSHAKTAVVQRPTGDDSLCEWASLLYRAAWYVWRRGDAVEAEEMSA
jgi:hypothetical protein